MNHPSRPENSSAVENVRSGQKLLIYAILLNIGTLPLRLGTHDRVLLIIAGLVGLAAIAVSIIGIIRVSSGLGYHLVWRIVLCLVYFGSLVIPFVSLIVLVLLNSKATARLRIAGYQVGLLGATRK